MCITNRKEWSEISKRWRLFIPVADLGKERSSPSLLPSKKMLLFSKILDPTMVYTVHQEIQQSICKDKKRRIIDFFSSLLGKPTQGSWKGFTRTEYRILNYFLVVSVNFLPNDRAPGESNLFHCSLNEF
jgi:hypothetical protein